MLVTTLHSRKLVRSTGKLPALRIGAFLSARVVRCTCTRVSTCLVAAPELSRLCGA